jgi:hypothetical protein
VKLPCLAGGFLKEQFRYHFAHWHTSAIALAGLSEAVILMAIGGVSFLRFRQYTGLNHPVEVVLHLQR